MEDQELVSIISLWFYMRGIHLKTKFRYAEKLKQLAATS